MKIRIMLFANFREVTRKKDVDLDVNGHTVRAAVDELISRYPGLQPLMLHEGKVKPYVNVLLNGQSVKEHMETQTIKDGDEIALFPPVSGG